MKGKYKRTKGWCYACDKEVVEQGKKRPYCGKKYYGAKIKKPSRHQILNGEKKSEADAEDN